VQQEDETCKINGGNEKLMRGLFEMCEGNGQLGGMQHENIILKLILK
jgi:hypothetical protein